MTSGRLSWRIEIEWSEWAELHVYANRVNLLGEKNTVKNITESQLETSNEISVQVNVHKMYEHDMKPKQVNKVKI
jgi:hypothetical protein